MNVKEAIEDAYRKITVVASDEAMTAEQAAAGTRQLKRMAASWQNQGFNLWTTTGLQVVLTTAAGYLLPIRPVRVLSARILRYGVETPMQEMGRAEYDDLPLKLSKGLPTTWYYDRQRATGTIYVWPAPQTAGYVLNLTIERAIAEMDLKDDLDVPPEFEDALVYGLASRLADDHPEADASRVVGRAEVLFQEALAADREGSVFFCGDDYEYGNWR